MHDIVSGTNARNMAFGIQVTKPIISPRKNEYMEANAYGGAHVITDKDDKLLIVCVRVCVCVGGCGLPNMQAMHTFPVRWQKQKLRCLRQMRRTLNSCTDQTNIERESDEAAASNGTTS